MFGSFVLSPMSANGLNPAMSPKPIGPLSCVSGSCGFWPACMVGSGCGVEDAPLAGAARAAGMVTDVAGATGAAADVAGATGTTGPGSGTVA